MARTRTKAVEGFVSIKVDKLQECDWNYKTDDEFLQEKLRQNMERNGQIENIIVREITGGKFEVVNGNHRYRVLKELGYEEAHCYNLGKVSETVAKRVAIETNETKFSVDSYLLANVVNDIKQEFDLEDLAATLPYTEVEFDGLNDLVDFDENDYITTEIEEENKESEEEKPKNYFMIKWSSEEEEQRIESILKDNDISYKKEN
jgi:hypothetical protein